MFAIINDSLPNYATTESNQVTSSNGIISRGNSYDADALFPCKLHRLLEYAELSGYSDIISWEIHGRAFKIHKRKDFLEKVMPQFFRQTKLASFRRQLNIYGFLRVTRGRDMGAYYHELFLRGMVFLSKNIIRQKVKGIHAKGKLNPASEPDFYSMPFVMNSTSEGNTCLLEQDRTVKPLLETTDTMSISRGRKNFSSWLRQQEEKQLSSYDDQWDIETFSFDESLHITLDPSSDMNLVPNYIYPNVTGSSSVISLSLLD
jgi:hypothetical protein